MQTCVLPHREKQTHSLHVDIVDLYLLYIATYLYWHCALSFQGIYKVWFITELAKTSITANLVFDNSSFSCFTIIIKQMFIFYLHKCNVVLFISLQNNCRWERATGVAVGEPWGVWCSFKSRYNRLRPCIIFVNL